MFLAKYIYKAMKQHVKVNYGLLCAKRICELKQIAWDWKKKTTKPNWILLTSYAGNSFILFFFFLTSLLIHSPSYAFVQFDGFMLRKRIEFRVERFEKHMYNKLFLSRRIGNGKEFFHTRCSVPDPWKFSYFC